MKHLLKVVVPVLVFMVLAAGHMAYAGPHDGAALIGKVIETMDSAGYTYVRIEKDGQKTWVAIPQAKVKKGQTVSFQPGTEMQNFESKTLRRTFDRIIFSGGLAK
jgi:hypothetical protein